MKFKLRMLCPFGAYTMRSLRAGMLAFVLCAFPVIKLIPNIFVAFLILILIFIAACAVYTQIKNYTLTTEEKQKIDAAPLPLWYPKMRWKRRRSEKSKALSLWYLCL